MTQMDERWLVVGNDGRIDTHFSEGGALKMIDDWPSLTASIVHIHGLTTDPRSEVIWSSPPEADDIPPALFNALSQVFISQGMFRNEEGIPRSTRTKWVRQIVGILGDPAMRALIPLPELTMPPGASDDPS